jgi:hypothetical protein
MATKAASSQLAFVSTLGVVEILGPGPHNHVCVRVKGGVGQHFVHVSMIEGVDSAPAKRARAAKVKAENERIASVISPVKAVRAVRSPKPRIRP